MSTQVADCGCYVDWSRGDFGPGCRGHWIEDSECKYKEPQPVAPGLVEAAQEFMSNFRLVQHDDAYNYWKIEIVGSTPVADFRAFEAALAAHRAQGERK